ncbi:hypothetical protein PSACC_00002 [Paramicrosporidium saccamoebae]|uniref:Uncharacterized protein n=1 Tax=Paramicrosporidium saccamoebae TaxID=1246581 RepID=A0A2H9TR15_9FUNG|nr:hypothetical protein PSACC_00002 [Paramicrosporidium saccamoebae]
MSLSCKICENPYRGSFPLLLGAFKVNLAVHPVDGSCVREAFLFTASIGFKIGISKVGATLQNAADEDAGYVKSWIGSQRRVDDVDDANSSRCTVLHSGAAAEGVVDGNVRRRCVDA